MSTARSGCGPAASPRLRGLTAGVERADSWATDAHKTLNVPYDNGLAIVADPAALHAAMSERAPYLIQDERPDPFDTVPEFSRRARGFTVWAALRSLGRQGVAEMVERLCARARRFADGMSAIEGVEVVNDVVFTQVCVSFGSDEVTREVARRLLGEGTAWMTPSTWHGRAVLRISVSNWRTTEEDVDRTLEAVRRVLARGAGGLAFWPAVNGPVPATVESPANAKPAPRLAAPRMATGHRATETSCARPKPSRWAGAPTATRKSGPSGHSDVRVSAIPKRSKADHEGNGSQGVDRRLPVGTG